MVAFLKLNLCKGLGYDYRCGLTHDPLLVPTKAPAGSKGFDALTTDGRKVQIKANHDANQTGFRGNADLIHVLKIEADGHWSEIYYGPFSVVKEVSRYSARDYKHMIAISKIRQLPQTGSI